MLFAMILNLVKETECRVIQQIEVETCGKFEDEVDRYVRNITTLNDEQKSIVRELLLENRDVFSDKPGFTSVYDHKIRDECNGLYM